MYQNLEIFNINFFRKDLEECLKNHTTYDNSYFQKNFLKFLNKPAAIKKQILHFNNNHLMSKSLRKVVEGMSKYSQQM